MQSNGQMGCMCVQAIYNHETSIFAIKELFVVVSNSRFFHRQKFNSVVTTIKTPHTIELHIYGMTLGSCSASLIFVVTLPLGGLVLWIPGLVSLLMDLFVQGCFSLLKATVI